MFKNILLAAVALLTLLPLSIEAANDKPFVIPELKTWTGGNGSFTISSATRIVCQGKDQAVSTVARQLAADYNKMTGHTLTVTLGKAQAGDIVLALKRDKKLGSEGYALNIGATITLTAPTRQGLLWGTRTLLQLIDEGKGRLPQGTTRDWPDYGFRGAMLDCARKFLPMSMLRQYVRIMSYYKMNTLHIHLNDNGFRQFFDNDWNKTYAAFRMECDTYPGLTARDGFYTKREFIALQELADSLGVEIIPEFDVPAHSLAFSHYKPEIGSKKYGMDHLDLFNPETYRFVDGLLKEYLDGPNPVFRGKYMHIGTDEYSNADTAVVEKFRYFQDRYIKYVESFGKKPIVWGSLTHAKGHTPVTSKDVLMYCWYNGYAQPDSMMKLGYNVISIPDGWVYIVPKAGYYYDYLNCKNLYENWTPAQIGGKKFDEKDPQIRGGAFAVWNDIVGNGISTRDIHYRCMPAIRTLATKMWTGKNVSVSWDDFNRQAQAVREAPGVNYAGHYPQGTVLTRDEVKPGDTLPINLIGWNYEVSFDVEPQPEALGTALFKYDDITFWLSDPISGKLGFSRDGYLNTFNYQFYPSVGDRSSEAQKTGNTADNSHGSTANSHSSKFNVQTSKSKVTIRGNREQTTLLINDKPVQTLSVKKINFGKGGDMYYISTLAFPLKHVGQFNSHITQLKAVSLEQ